MITAPESQLQRLLEHANISSGTLELLVKQYPYLREALIAHIRAPAAGEEMEPVNPALVQLLVTLKTNLSASTAAISTQNLPVHQSTMVTGPSLNLPVNPQASTAKQPQTAHQPTSLNLEKCVGTAAPQQSSSATKQSLLGRLQTRLEQIQGRSIDSLPVESLIEQQVKTSPTESVASSNQSAADEEMSAAAVQPQKSYKIGLVDAASERVNSFTAAPAPEIPSAEPQPQIIEPGELSAPGDEVEESAASTPSNITNATAVSSISAVATPAVISSPATQPAANKQASSLFNGPAGAGIKRRSSLSQQRQRQQVNEANNDALVLHASSSLTTQMRQEMESVLQAMEQDERELEEVHGKLRHHDGAIQEIQKSIDELLKKISMLYVLLSKNRTTLTEHQQSKQNLLQDASRLTHALVEREQRIGQLAVKLGQYGVQAMPFQQPQTEIPPRKATRLLQYQSSSSSSSITTTRDSNSNDLLYEPQPHPPGYPFASKPTGAGIPPPPESQQSLVTPDQNIPPIITDHLYPRQTQFSQVNQQYQPLPKLPQQRQQQHNYHIGSQGSPMARMSVSQTPPSCSNGGISNTTLTTAAAAATQQPPIYMMQPPLPQQFNQQPMLATVAAAAQQQQVQQQVQPQQHWMPATAAGTVQLPAQHIMQPVEQPPPQYQQTIQSQQQQMYNFNQQPQQQHSPFQFMQFQHRTEPQNYWPQQLQPQQNFPSSQSPQQLLQYPHNQSISQPQPQRKSMGRRKGGYQYNI